MKANTINIMYHNGDMEVVILNIIEFSSDRKRMTIFTNNPNNNNTVIMLTKGADSVILPRLNNKSNDVLESSMNLIEK